MKRLIVLSVMLLFGSYAFGQKPVEHLDAEVIGPMMLNKTRSELIDLMKCEKCVYMDSSFAVYSVYSKREGKNIHLKACFSTFMTDVPKVGSVDFIWNEKNTYGTHDLQEAFWIEHLKDLCR